SARSSAATSARANLSLGCVREDEDVEVGSGRSEPPASVEGEGTLVAGLDDDLEPLGTAGDRIALRPLEQLPTDPFCLVSRMHTELFDPEAIPGFLEGNVARGLAAELGDEDRVAGERRDRPVVVLLPEGELRNPEQQPFVLPAEGPHR